MLIPTSLLEHFIVFACLSVFRRFFYCVLIPVRILSIPRIIPLFTTLLVPSLLLVYRPTGVTYSPEFVGTLYMNVIVGSYMIWLSGIYHTSSIAREYKIAYSYGYYELSGFGGQENPDWMISGLVYFLLLIPPFFCLAVLFLRTWFKPAQQALQ